jgi:hypothetical protein
MLRRLPYVLASIIIGLISLSRLYLGEHWLTDVLGSIFIGLMIVMLVTLLYIRNNKHGIHKKLQLPKVLIVFSSIFFGSWLVYCLVFFPHEVAKHDLRWETKYITFTDLQDQKVPDLPLYRINRLGYPMQAMNVEWLGSIKQIRQALLRQGWLEQSMQINLPYIIRNFVTDHDVSHVSVLPQLYHNRRPVLVLTKPTKQHDIALILSLWESDIKISRSKVPFYLGTVYYHKAVPKRLQLAKHGDFIGGTQGLVKYLQSFSWQQLTYLVNAQPAEMHGLNWSGKVLLIWP